MNHNPNRDQLMKPKILIWNLTHIYKRTHHTQNRGKRICARKHFDTASLLLTVSQRLAMCLKGEKHVTYTWPPHSTMSCVFSIAIAGRAPKYDRCVVFITILLYIVSFQRSLIENRISPYTIPNFSPGRKEYTSLKTIPKSRSM